MLRGLSRPTVPQVTRFVVIVVHWQQGASMLYCGCSLFCHKALLERSEQQPLQQREVPVMKLVK